MHLEDDRRDELTPARLRAVIAVADTGGFSTAANHLGLSQSAVSRAVASVERSLGAAVFDRSTRSVALTTEGREFVEHATLVLAELDAAVRAMTSDERPPPRLTIASLASISRTHLPTALRDEGRPRRVRCIEALQAGVEEALTSGAAVAGFGDLATLPRELAGRPLWSESFRLAVAHGHPLARRRSVEVTELSDETLISFTRDAELRSTVDRRLAEARRLRTPDITVDRFGTALAMVAAELGVMTVPAVIAPVVPQGVRLVDIGDPALERTIGLIHRIDAAVPGEVDRLARHIARAAGRTAGVQPT